MGSRLASNEDVRAIIEAIGNRNVEWLKSLYDSKRPSPSHLMFACASVIGDGGQEHVASLIKKVPSKERRSKFIDLAIQLAHAEDAQPEAPEAGPAVETSSEAEVVSADPNPVVEEVEEAATKTRRRRRTKKEMEEARRAEALENSPHLEDIKEMIAQGNKAIFEIDERLKSLEASFLQAQEVNERYFTSLAEKVLLPALEHNSLKLTSLKEGLVAAELELVMDGKLSSPAISESMNDTWPSED